jgi:transglutaminase-like putative cysteine protease
MADEPRPQTIQERIASLNQTQVGRIPNGTPQVPTRPAASRAKSINNPPHEVNGSVVNTKAIGNKPAPIRQNGLLPAPNITRNEPNNTGTSRSKPPPPLPARRNSSQPGPALPPRRPSAQTERKQSAESTTSTASYNTTSTSGTTNTAESKNRVLAPAWGEVELPPLPVREPKGQTVPQRPTGSNSSSAWKLREMPLKGSVISGLSSRIFSSEKRNSDRSELQLPVRRPSSDQAKQLPIRQPDQNTRDEGSQPAARKIPPVPSADALNKIKQSSFASLPKHLEESEPPAANGDTNGHAENRPPPVPLASRPDLAAIQATKPKFQAHQQKASPDTSSVVCMKCRDFSGPDNHAVQFPRESLPTDDLAWLAHQLTAPFPSLTDKARAIFTWLHHNIKYDVDAFFNNRVQPTTPSKTFSTGLAVCEGYAGLFSNLATHAGLEALVVGGHGKGFGHSQLAPGSRLPPFEGNHAWNVVKIDGGKWKLIDSCWGAGAVQGHGMPYIQRFDPTNFTKSNDEFGLSHYPERKDQFYTDDGRPGMSWEEYVLQNHEEPFGLKQPTIFTTAFEEGVGDRSFLPACKQISLQQTGPIRFQFSLVCEHWTLAQHSKKSAPFLFLLHTHGIDGRKDEHIPFNYVKGRGPNGGGDVWYVDIADPRTLGAPGQKLAIANVTSFGSHNDARGLSVQEFRQQVGRVGMGWSYIADWQLVA